jgi:antirestriction protein ArdC
VRDKTKTGGVMNNKELYSIVTNKILEGLKRGEIPWRKPWKGCGRPSNFISKKPYRGINQILLWLDMQANGYKSGYYLTFNQVKAKGGRVKKDSKSQLIIFWSFIKKDLNEIDTITGKRKQQQYAILKYHRVFNVEQCEGLKLPEDKNPIDTFNKIQECENIVTGYSNRPEIRHGIARAYYSPGDDYINMPNQTSFYSEEEYYSTLFHELVHSTGHKDRLDRADITAGAFGDANYSREELTAEIGTAFICTIAGIDNSTIENSQAYINNWIKALENDEKMIVLASGKAQKAVDYMMGIKFDNTEVEEQEEKESVTV